MLQLIDANPKKILEDLLKQAEADAKEEIVVGDRRYLFLSTLATTLSVLFAKTNLAFSQNFLSDAYSIGLDKFGVDYNTPRLQPQKAKTKVKFTLSTELETDLTIINNTMITTNSQQIFLTTQDLIIKAGQTTGTVDCISQFGGSAYNNINIGDINILVVPIPYVQSVSNTAKPTGGTDLEDDESYRQRLKIASSKASSAGSVVAYKSWTLEADNNIVDVIVDTPEPGTVIIKPIMRGGGLPSEDVLDNVRNIFDSNKNYPNTTKLEVQAPEEFTFNINISYTVEKVNKNIENEIKNNVEKAVDNYINLQISKAGVNINPDQLRRDVLNAGAYTVTILQPTFTNKNLGKINKLGTKKITYKGLL